ncbi:MAG: hypothetical protein QOD39_1950 [Mycobacterium sp.]|nr:hypothetical protein [Mycobacterium sp.]
MDELALLQVVRLKGRVRPADLAATLDEDEVVVGAAVERFAEAGLLVQGKAVRLTPNGKDRLAELLVKERGRIDNQAIAAIYDDFRAVNREFKALISDWQLRNGAPNDHTDADHDAAVLGRLEGTHDTILPILASASEQLPRLDAYSAKLSAALEKIRDGDATWLTRPLVDSYHTVWFELHEELIGAAGLTREDEARAGHAE